MTIYPFIKKMALLAALVLMRNFAIAQTDSLQQLKLANKWVKSKVWAKHLPQRVFADVNSVEFKHQYETNKTTWDKVFQFLADTARLDTLKPAKYPVDGDNAYATITDMATRDPDMVKWESHRKNIDLQYVIRGEEKMGVANVSTATVTMPYNDTKDLANYTAYGKYYIATPKEFYLFFPEDAHRPNLKVDGIASDKKVVIKIKYVR